MLSIVIPAYEEGENISRLIEEIRGKVRAEHEMLIVIDSWADGTRKHVKAGGDVHFILNRAGGFAKAVEMGIKHSNGEYVVIIPADLSDDVADINAMHFIIKNSDYAMVGASRYKCGGQSIGSPWFKSLCSRIVNLLARLKVGGMSDSTNAFKVYDGKIIKGILTYEELESTGFAVSLELVRLLHKKDHKLIEIPTLWRERTVGESNFKMRKVMWEYIRQLLS